MVVVVIGVEPKVVLGMVPVVVVKVLEVVLLVLVAVVMVMLVIAAGAVLTSTLQEIFLWKSGNEIRLRSGQPIYRVK